MTTVMRGKQVLAGTSGSYNGGTVRENFILSTPDATATVIAYIPVAVGEAAGIKAFIVGMKSDASASLVRDLTWAVHRQSAGNVTSGGAAQGVDLEDSPGAPAVTVNANTTAQTAEIKVAGIAAETWHWECHLIYTKVV